MIRCPCCAVLCCAQAPRRAPSYGLAVGVGVLPLTHHADGYLDEGGAVAIWPVAGGLEAASGGLAVPGDILRVRWDAHEDAILDLPATLVSVRRGQPADLAGMAESPTTSRSPTPMPGRETCTPTRPTTSASLPRTAGGYRGRPPFSVDTAIPG